MQTWIMKECPDINFDPTRKAPRDQWSWERQDSAAAAKETMYWDCIFIGDLYQRGMQPVKLSGALHNFFPKIEQVLGAIQDAKDAFEATLASVAKQVTDLNSTKDELEHQL